MGDPDRVAGVCQQEAISCVIIDLSLPGLNLPDWVAGFGENPIPPLIGYDSHVRTDRFEQARAAGCTHLLTRGQVAQQLPGLLQGILSKSSTE